MKEYLRSVRGTPVHVYASDILVQSFLSYGEFCNASYAGKEVIKSIIDTELIWRDIYQLRSELLKPDDVVSMSRDQYKMEMYELRIKGAKNNNRGEMVPN